MAHVAKLGALTDELVVLLTSVSAKVSKPLPKLPPRLTKRTV
jgi:hypothetical protein